MTIGQYDVAIARDGDEFFALQDLCSHAEVALTEGEVADCQIECWLHGSMFDLRTGKPTTYPATEPVSTFAVEVAKRRHLCRHRIAPQRHHANLIRIPRFEPRESYQ